MHEIDLGSLKMPLNAATKSFAILAKRGAGKTYLGGVMAEEFSKNGIPFVVFDPIDVWFGLRLASDGKGRGLPVVVFGLQHADIEIDRDMGRAIARAVVDEGISCVISTKGMPKVGARHLIAEFAEELLDINNTPRHVFIEEAHEYVPQRVMSAQAKTFSAVESLVTMGRNVGIGVTMLNQRAATVNKDVLTQIDTLLALRSVGPQDRKALQDWVEYHSAEGDFKKFVESLPSLPTGEGWVWSPEFLGIFEKFQTRKRETFHPDPEKIGAHFVIPKLDQIDIQTFVTKFKETSASLKESTRKGEKKRMLSKGMAAVVEPRPGTVHVERQAQKDVYGEEIRSLKNSYESQLLTKDVKIRELETLLVSIRRLVGGTSEGTPTPVVSSNIQFWIEKAGRGGQGKILQFLADKAPNRFTRPQIGFATSMVPTSGTFNTYISNLKKRSLILEENKLLFINPDI